MCSYTLQDYVENPQIYKNKLKPISVLSQAMAGIAHLHSLDIGRYNYNESIPGLDIIVWLKMICYLCLLYQYVTVTQSL